VAGNTIDTDAIVNLVNAHQLLLGDQSPSRLELRGEACVGFLAHHHQDVRLSHIRVENRVRRENDLRAGRAAAGLRAEALSHGGESALENRGRLADDAGGQNDALAPKSGDTDFG
jgi:hypothetical protein